MIKIKYSVSGSFISLFCILFLFNGCNTKTQPQSAKQNPVSAIGDNSQNALDWEGVYKGIFPCADCSGIKTELRISRNLTYVLRTQYTGKSVEIYTNEGSFAWNETGGKITLSDMPENHDHQYLVGENILFKLNQEGNRIAGDLSQVYRLLKNDDQLTDKYWRLVTLNDQEVKINQAKVPHIKFQAEGSQVIGNNGCNSFSGSFELKTDGILHLKSIAVTAMACLNENVETTFDQLLTDSLQHTCKDDTLMLSRQET